MVEIINQILIIIENAGLLAYFFIFLFSFLESVAFLGLIVPGGTILLFAGFLVSQEVLTFFKVFLFGFTGSFLGDILSFYFGKKGRSFLIKKNLLKNESFIKTELFFHKYGDKSIILSRFISPLRPMISLVVGFFKMSFKKFIILDFLSGLFFSLLFIFLGKLLGAGWLLFQERMTLGFLVLGFLIVIFVGFSLIFRKRITKI